MRRVSERGAPLQLFVLALALTRWWWPTGLLVDFANNGMYNALELGLLLLELVRFSLGIRFEPLELLLDRLHYRILIVLAELLAEALLFVRQLCLERIGVAFKLVARLDAVAHLLIVVGKPFRVLLLMNAR